MVTPTIAARWMGAPATPPPERPGNPIGPAERFGLRAKRPGPYDERVLIQSIQFKNFKVLRDTTLPLGRFTLIVGPNGSGKTSALQALAFANVPSEFDRLRPRVSVGAQASPRRECEIEFLLAESGEEGRLKFRGHSSTRPLRDVSDREIPILSGESAESAPRKPSFRRSLAKQMLTHIKIFSLDASAIAVGVPQTYGVTLSETGKELGAWLTHLRDTNDACFAKIAESIPQWFPEHPALDMETNKSNNRVVSLGVPGSSERIPAHDLSQGTLLGLCILAIAHLPEPPPLVCFEEPDRGLHPRLLRDVKDALDRLCYPERFGEDRDAVQVVVTTHNPYFLDLYKDRPEDIIIAEKTGNEAKFVRLATMNNMDEILQGAPLGEVWFSGVLGGVPAGK